MEHIRCIFVFCEYKQFYNAIFVIIRRYGAAAILHRQNMGFRHSLPQEIIRSVPLIIEAIGIKILALPMGVRIDVFNFLQRIRNSQ